MKKELLLMLSCLACILPFTCAQSLDEDSFSANPVYNGDVYFSLDKDVYSAGEILKTEYTVSNMEKFPLVDAYLVVEVVKGGQEPAYPPHASDKDNVLYEEIIRNINIPAIDKTVVPFSYEIPDDLASGDYLLEVYLKTERTSVIGMPHIMQSPKYEAFKVVGEGTFPYAMISRTGTLFENESGPVGVGVEGGSTVVGSVMIKSLTQSPLDNLVLTISLCEWDDTACAKDMIWSKDYPVPSLAAGSSARVNVDFKAPDKPSAYAVRLELKDAGGRTVSIYRSRIVVKGETARIRKMAVSDYHYTENEAGNVMLLIGPSPDHYTNPVTKDAKASVSITSGGKTLYSESSLLPPLSGLSYPITAFTSFNFSAPQEMKVFEVCSQIDSSQGVIYDKYCYVVDSSKFVTESCGDGRCGAGEDGANCCMDCGCPEPMKCMKGACQMEAEEATIQTTSTTVQAELPEKTERNDNSIYYTAFIVLLFFTVIYFIFLKKSKNKSKRE